MNGLSAIVLSTTTIVLCRLFFVGFDNEMPPYASQPLVAPSSIVDQLKFEKRVGGGLYVGIRDSCLDERQASKTENCSGSPMYSFISI